MTRADTYTHGHHEAVLRSHRQRTAANSAKYLMPRLARGASLLDIGCGPGTLTVDLAQLVAPGPVVGIDLEASVLDDARRMADARGITNLTLRGGDFRDLVNEPLRFSVVHAHQVLQHLRDPVAALHTMAALAEPGGTLAARDGDYSAMFWAPADRALDRFMEIYLAVARRNGGEPDAGRHLLRFAREAGLLDIAFTTSTWTYASSEDIAWWSDLWVERISNADSPLAQQAVRYGVATVADLCDVAAGLRNWATLPHTIFVVPHGELLARPPL
jgi:SAM-dependent methyltransferase